MLKGVVHKAEGPRLQLQCKPYHGIASVKAEQYAQLNALQSSIIYSSEWASEIESKGKKNWKSGLE